MKAKTILQLRAADLILSAAVLAGCYPTLPMPPSTDHRGEAPIEVPHPPPAPRVDVVLDPPADYANPVWVDGQWLWLGRRWVWEPGRWVDLEPGMAYAGPSLFRRGDGQLVWFRGTLRRTTAR